MSEEIKKQIIFYENYGAVGSFLCPLMADKRHKTDFSCCDCEPLREKLAVTSTCGVDGKCPVREYFFSSPISVDLHVTKNGV